ncbi:hypothetical protein DFJ74DRAFT_704313 [Hyaloraphidium curvatum]|nr:hypothetical protein DFJ74DRAFT_704313 [Hyaloraphidium curvatum]
MGLAGAPAPSAPKLDNAQLAPFKCTEVQVRDRKLSRVTCYFDVDDPGTLRSSTQFKLVLEGIGPDGKRGKYSLGLDDIKNVSGSKETNRLVVAFDSDKPAVTMCLEESDVDRKEGLRGTLKMIRSLGGKSSGGSRPHSSPPPVGHPGSAAVEDDLFSVAAPDTKKRKIEALGARYDAPRKSTGGGSKAKSILTAGYNPTDRLKAPEEKRGFPSSYESPIPKFVMSSSPPPSPTRRSLAERRPDSGVRSGQSSPHLATIGPSSFYTSSSRKREREHFFMPGMSNKENVALHQRMMASSGTKRDGFRNQGQTCYLNAVLQLLYHLTRFKTTLLRSSDDVARSAADGGYDEDKVASFRSSVGESLAHVFRSKQGKDVVDPVALKRCIGSILKQFANNDQEDAHELLYALLDQVQMDFDPFGSGADPVVNPVATNFVWELEQSMKCRECVYESRRSEVFNDLSLDLPSEKEIEETVSYKCERCDCKEATLRRRIVRLPRFFLIHIKRYVVDMAALALGKDAVVQKRADFVGIEDALDFSKWCAEGVHQPPPDAGEKGGSTVDTDAPAVSSLFAGTTKDDRGEAADEAPRGSDADFWEADSDVLDPSKLNEDEQMQWALRASLKYSSEAPSSDNGVIELDSDGDHGVSAAKPVASRHRRRYRLQGVINHIGSSYNRGHYVADIRDPKTSRWQTFNDDMMSTLGSFDALRQKRGRSVYILSFQLTD